MPATTPSRRRRVAGCVERAEAQRVQQRDRPRAHREDVAEDAADAGGGALKRLDERGMVVRFDLEDGREAVADVDDAGVLAGPLQHLRTLGRQLLQMHARALVAAVLAPHHREDAELGEVRLAAEERRRCARIRPASDRGVRGPCESIMRRRARPRDRPTCSELRRRTAEHDQAVGAAQRAARSARSGCGIMPTTLRALVAQAGDRRAPTVRIRLVGRRRPSACV